MKKLAIFFVFLTLLSCSQSKNQESFSYQKEISYEIDTVKIDAKGEFLFLNYELSMSDYDPNTDLLYNINPQSSRMEIIDMEKQELKELIQYDKDGPNAVKEMITTGIKMTDSGEMWFTDYLSIIHLDTQGQKLEHLRLTNENFAGDTLPEGWEIDGMGKITRSGKYFISHYGDYAVNGAGLQGLAIIDLKSHHKHLIPLDAFKSLEKYEISSHERKSSVWSLITITDDEVLHYNQAHNKLYKIDLKTLEVTQKILRSDLITNEKPGKYPKQANSTEQFEEFKTIMDQEISFGNWIHDPEGDHFWRFSREKSGGTVDKPEFKVVITVLDKSLNQIAERKLDSKDSIPFFSTKFFRKGDLYMFLNMNDELAFVRLKPVLN